MNIRSYESKCREKMMLEEERWAMHGLDKDDPACGISDGGKTKTGMNTAGALPFTACRSICGDMTM